MTTTGTSKVCRDCREPPGIWPNSSGEVSRTNWHRSRSRAVARLCGISSLASERIGARRKASSTASGAPSRFAPLLTPRQPRHDGSHPGKFTLRQRGWLLNRVAANGNFRRSPSDFHQCRAFDGIWICRLWHPCSTTVRSSSSPYGFAAALRARLWLSKRVQR